MPTVVRVEFARVVWRGLFWLGVVVIFRPESVAISQAQPEPKTPFAAAENWVWKLVKLPKAALMAPCRLYEAETSYWACGVPAGVKDLKKKAWFQAPPLREH